MADIILTSKRLNLRFIKKSDLPIIHKLQSIAEVDRYNTLGIPKNSAETIVVMAPLFKALEQAHINKYTFVISITEINQFIGLIALNLGNPKYRAAEVWYKLFPVYWRKGYATETLKTILEFGFSDLKLHRIEAGCAVDNLASVKVLENAGMSYEGRKRKTLPLKSGWSDNFEYGILENDYNILKISRRL
jgi:RimJ/RimL family protein N-acetyltransferase